METPIFPWFINSQQPTKIAIIGDMILDEYLGGSVHRISPEAPVPVHLVHKTNYSAGGAANVARNIQLSGGQALLFGVWGKDESAKILKQLLVTDQINISGILTVTDRPTVKKTRIVSGSQQLIRIDWEKNHSITQEQQTSLLNNLKSAEFQAILISDYGKGSLPEDLIQKVIALGKARKVPVIVDPKGKDFTRYQGCDLMTPNRKEAIEALGLEVESTYKGEDLARRLQTRYGLADILVTMGAEGMLFQKRSEEYPEEGKTWANSLHKRPRAREVFDVSGAGDTVAAIIALGLGAGASMELSMELANLAAGIVVEKLGTQPVTRGELESACQEDHSMAPHSTEGKVMDAAKLANKLQILRQQGKKIVFTNGCFDLLHAGHLTYLEQARAHGDYLVIGVNSDDSIRRLKGSSRPIVDLSHRMRMLAGLACVDFVTSFSEDTPLELIRSLTPQVLAKGADYQEHEIVGGDWVKGHGGEVIRLPLVPGQSTSQIVLRIRQLD